MNLNFLAFYKYIRANSCLCIPNKAQGLSLAFTPVSPRVVTAPPFAGAVGQALLLSSVSESAGSDMRLGLAVRMTISTFKGLGAVYVFSGLH